MMAISSFEKDVASARLHFCFVIIHITFEATLIDEGRLNVRDCSKPLLNVPSLMNA